jgi:hypothetical protein
MKRLTIIASSMAIVLAGYGIACAADAQVADAKAKDQPVKKQTMCPIMEGNPINTNLFVDVDGKRIYVCCKGCLAPVKQDAAKIIAKLEKEGITLDKAPVPAKKTE